MFDYRCHLHPYSGFISQKYIADYLLFYWMAFYSWNFGKKKSIVNISGNQLAVSQILTASSTETKTHSSFTPSGLVTLNCQGQASCYKAIAMVADCSVSSRKQILQQRCRIIKNKTTTTTTKQLPKWFPIRQQFLLL